MALPLLCQKTSSAPFFSFENNNHAPSNRLSGRADLKIQERGCDWPPYLVRGRPLEPRPGTAGRMVSTRPSFFPHWGKTAPCSLGLSCPRVKELPEASGWAEKEQKGTPRRSHSLFPQQLVSRARTTHLQSTPWKMERGKPLLGLLCLVNPEKVSP